MRRSRFTGPLLIFATGLAACGESPTELQAAPGAVAAASAAMPADKEIKVPYHQPVIIPCGRLGQEIVPFDGTVHGVFHFSMSAGGKLHLRAQTNAQGMTGIGLVSGDTYVLNGGSKDSYEFDLYALPYTYTYVNNFHVESAGATGNIVAHETLKLYFDENGVPTVQSVNFVAECKNFAG